jgi:phosphatidylglycerol:prolipoprotein diacylglycerol transferase
MPLHPTQVYSSINGFLLAAVTFSYCGRGRFAGDVFALGTILYAVSRFLIEFVRADELGQLGTGLTISQLLCLGLLATGLALAAWQRWSGRRTGTSDAGPGAKLALTP